MQNLRSLILIRTESKTRNHSLLSINKKVPFECYEQKSASCKLFLFLPVAVTVFLAPVCS